MIATTLVSFCSLWGIVAAASHMRISTAAVENLFLNFFLRLRGHGLQYIGRYLLGLVSPLWEYTKVCLLFTFKNLTSEACTRVLGCLQDTLVWQGCIWEKESSCSLADFRRFSASIVFCITSIFLFLDAWYCNCFAVGVFCLLLVVFLIDDCACTCVRKIKLFNVYSLQFYYIIMVKT